MRVHVQLAGGRTNEWLSLTTRLKPGVWVHVHDVFFPQDYPARWLIDQRRKTPDEVSRGFKSREFDAEGRIIRADWNDLSVISAYLPSGSSGDERQTAKYRFLDHFEQWINGLMQEHRDTGREFIICGDWNIAHHEADREIDDGKDRDRRVLPHEHAPLVRHQVRSQTRPNIPCGRKKTMIRNTTKIAVFCS